MEAERLARAGAGNVVCVLGDGPLGEVVRDVLDEHDRTELVPTAAQAQLAVVVDPTAPQGVPGLTYVRLA